MLLLPRTSPRGGREERGAPDPVEEVRGEAALEERVVPEERPVDGDVRGHALDDELVERGEEVEYLQAHGVAVTVVNGITAGLAGMSSLGVSLTHREHAHGVLFVTGHAKPGDGVDWATLSRTAAQAKLTLVIYMGIRGAEQLQVDLLQGLPADTPVAVIHNVSLPDQRHAICTLETLHETVLSEALASPSVIVVGDVLEGLASVQSHSFTQVLRDAQG